MESGNRPPELDQRIREARQRAGLDSRPGDTPPHYGRGLSLGLELAVAVFLCALIGGALDRWLDSKPWLMLLGLLLGLAVGMWNLYRVSLGIGPLSVGVPSRKDE